MKRKESKHHSVGDLSSPVSDIPLVVIFIDLFLMTYPALGGVQLLRRPLLR